MRPEGTSWTAKTFGTELIYTLIMPFDCTATGGLSACDGQSVAAVRRKKIPPSPNSDEVCCLPMRSEPSGPFTSTTYRERVLVKKLGALLLVSKRFLPILSHCTEGVVTTQTRLVFASGS